MASREQAASRAPARVSRRTRAAGLADLNLLDLRTGMTCLRSSVVHGGGGEVRGMPAGTAGEGGPPLAEVRVTAGVGMPFVA
ncbi:hypothetical protein GCM10010508_33910 [Streptomyces naganishii JCM 4654]|uniref:Uncharacterized protein n=1 Tax=Streptomyces naganishii JCM 4654 TaxID=1306179 RepID=A0A919CVP9_9ACTN|nr:hypothetical protein GCM10010508_33910 [Streptomyces naganishii JCM 4654]